MNSNTNIKLLCEMAKNMDEYREAQKKAKEVLKEKGEYSENVVTGAICPYSLPEVYALDVAKRVPPVLYDFPFDLEQEAEVFVKTLCGLNELTFYFCENASYLQKALYLLQSAGCRIERSVCFEYFKMLPKDVRGTDKEYIVASKKFLNMPKQYMLLMRVEKPIKLINEAEIEFTYDGKLI